MGKSRLTPEQWEEVKKRYFAGERYCDIAGDYGIDAETIRKHSQNFGWSKDRKRIRNEAHAECLTHAKAETVRQGDRAALIASDLLDIIEQGVKEQTLFQNAGDIQKLSASLVALRSITGETAKRSAEEQRARIEKLRAETAVNVNETKQVKITFDTDMEDLSQ